MKFCLSVLAASLDRKGIFCLLLTTLWSTQQCPVSAAEKPIGSAYITPITRNDTKSSVTLLLAADGKARLPIVISEKASDATKAVAAELAAYLKRISGASF